MVVFGTIIRNGKHVACGHVHDGHRQLPLVGGRGMDVGRLLEHILTIALEFFFEGDGK